VERGLGATRLELGEPLDGHIPERFHVPGLDPGAGAVLAIFSWAKFASEGNGTTRPGCMVILGDLAPSLEIGGTDEKYRGGWHKQRMLGGRGGRCQR